MMNAAAVVVAPVYRWFLRCVDCLAVGAVDSSLTSTYGGQTIARQPLDGTCPCGGRTEIMGRVGRSGKLISEHFASPCDAACTGARGPNCDCKCNGANHGSRMIVRVVTDRGDVPRYELKADESRGAEFRAALKAAEARCLAYAESIRDIQDAKSAGTFVDGASFAKLVRCRGNWTAVYRAKSKRTHRGRVDALAKVAADLV